MSKNLSDSAVGPPRFDDQASKQDAVQAAERIAALEPYMRRVARAIQRAYGGRGDAISSKVQSAFVKAQEKIKAGFRLPSEDHKLEGWIRSIVRTKMIDHYRKEDALRRLRTRLELPAVTEAPDGDAERAEEAERMRGALDTLDERSQWLLALHVVDQQSFRQIAASEGVAFTTVVRSVNRALRKLRTAYLANRAAVGGGRAR